MINETRPHEAQACNNGPPQTFPAGVPSGWAERSNGDSRRKPTGCDRQDGITSRPGIAQTGT